MGCKLDWVCINDIAEYLGIKDIEHTIDLLLIFKDQAEAIEK